MKEWQELYDTYRTQADLVAIYIREAHPTDEWYAFDAHKLLQPSSTEERLRVATAFVAAEKPTAPLFVDKISDDANHLFHAWPEKLVIVEDGRISFISQNDNAPMGFDVEDAAKYLRRKFPQVA